MEVNGHMIYNFIMEVKGLLSINHEPIRTPGIASNNKIDFIQCENLHKETVIVPSKWTVGQSMAVSVTNSILHIFCWQSKSSYSLLYK